MSYVHAHISTCYPPLTHAIASMKVNHNISKSQHKDTLTYDESIDTGQSDMPSLKSFHSSSSRHSDVSPEELSDHWGISVATAAKKLEKKMQKYLRSAILLLARRYRMDRGFTRKMLQGTGQQHNGL
jgi:hypothetical protein